jgi:hypothetical protein
MGRKVGGPRKIVHADGTEEEADVPLTPGPYAVPPGGAS